MPRRTLFLLTALLVLCAAGAARGQSPEVCENKLPKDPAYYADMKELPPGKYGFGYLFDKPQFDDPSTPVVLRGMGAISSPNRALKLSCVEIENRTKRTVRAVQLRWAVSALAEGGGVSDKAEPLAQGVLPYFAAEVPPGGRQKIEVRGVHFADFFQQAAARGELAGRYNVIIGVARVEYTDGTAEDLP